MPTRVLVYGGRDYTDEATEFKALDILNELFGPLIIIEGEYRGADKIAAKWAKSRNQELLPFPANWTLHGKAAGPIRNKQMRDEGRPNYGLEFPGGDGTKNMRELLDEKDIPILSGVQLATDIQ